MSIKWLDPLWLLHSPPKILTLVGQFGTVACMCTDELLH